MTQETKPRSKDHSEDKEHSNNSPRPAERFEKKSKKDGQTTWVIKVTILTFILTAAFTFLSDVALSGSTLVVAILIVLLLIIVNIIFDVIAIAVTSCDVAPLSAMSARKVHGSKTALKLVKNANKVSSVCADVIGDICGIVSGACGVVIVSKVLSSGIGIGETILTLLISSVIAALTVGGKAFGKKLAITHSRDLVMFAGRVLAIFCERKRK